MIKHVLKKIEGRRGSNLAIDRLLVGIKDILFIISKDLPSRLLSRLSRDYVHIYKWYCFDLKNFKIIKLFPNFIIIGAMKSGTTSLYQYLRFHPDIFMYNIKEPYHLLDLSGKRNCSTIWHNFLPIVKRTNAFFKLLLKGYSGQRIFGEASTDYTKMPLRGLEVPRKIWKENPDAKILYVIRNPLERILSHYRYVVKVKQSDIPLNELLKKNFKEPLSVSLYYYQLSHYLEYFNKDHIKIILFEDLKKDPERVLKEVFQFLGVTDKIGYPKEYMVFNESEGKEKIFKENLKFTKENFKKLIGPIKKDARKLEAFLGKKIEWDLSEKKWCLND